MGRPLTDPAVIEQARQMVQAGNSRYKTALALGVSRNTVNRWTKTPIDTNKEDPKNKSYSDAPLIPLKNSLQDSPVVSPSQGSKRGANSDAHALKAAKRNKLNDDHLRRVSALRRNVEKLLKRDDCGASPGQSIASAAKALVSAVDDLHELELKAHGLESGAAAVEQRVIEVPTVCSPEDWQKGPARALSGPVVAINPNPRRN